MIVTIADVNYKHLFTFISRLIRTYTTNHKPKCTYMENAKLYTFLQILNLMAQCIAITFSGRPGSRGMKILFEILHLL